MPQKKQNNRGKIANVVKYIFGKTKQLKKDELSVNGEDIVEFIGTSKSLAVSNPFYQNVNGVVQKVTIQDVDLEPLIQQMLMPEAKNTRVQHPFEHISVSLKQGESLSNRKWYSVISKLTEELGLVDNHWVAVKHNDTDNEHVHLVIQMITNSVPYRRCVLNNSYKVLAGIRNTLEKEFSLSHDHNPFSDDFKPGAKKASYKTSVNLIRDKLDQVLSSDRISLPDFIKQLNNSGIGCFAQLRKGELIGLSFSLGDFKVRSSKMGVGYSLKDLKTRGLSYDKNEDWHKVEELNQKEQLITSISKAYKQRNSIQETNSSSYVGYLVNKPKTRSFKASSKPNIFRLWLPVNTVGKTRSQIESEIMIRKIISQVLEIYFIWLREKRDNEKKARELMCHYFKCVDNKSSLFKKLVGLCDDSLFTFIANTDNDEHLRKQEVVLGY